MRGLCSEASSCWQKGDWESGWLDELIFRNLQDFRYKWFSVLVFESVERKSHWNFIWYLNDTTRNDIKGLYDKFLDRKKMTYSNVNDFIPTINPRQFFFKKIFERRHDAWREIVGCIFPNGHIKRGANTVLKNSP